MLQQPTLQLMRSLKLYGMCEGFEQQLEQPQAHDLAFDERLALLLQREQLHRDNNRLSRLLKVARLRHSDACAEDINYRHRRGLNKSQMAQLLTGDWALGGQNLLITGPTGCGKTWLACALGHQLCRNGLTVRYWRLAKLFETLRIAHGEAATPGCSGSYRRYSC